MWVTQAALQRTMIGIGLKSIGSTFQVLDVPPEHSHLRMKIVQRDALKFSFIFVVSLILDKLFQLTKPKHPLLQFLPQAVTIVMAEWLSRKLTSFNKVFNQSFNALPGSPSRQLILPKATPSPRFTPPGIYPFTYNHAHCPVEPVYFQSKAAYTPVLMPQPTYPAYYNTGRHY